MKKILFSASALAATSGFVSAQGGVTVSGTASMGILGGEWIKDRETQTVPLSPEHEVTVHGDVLPGQNEYEFHTDIDVHFTMSGQTDAGLTFGASIDLDESDGNDDAGNSPAFDGRSQGGEEIFISGALGTLTIGDTDGALDWALQEIAIGGSLGDLHTTHAGYNGNGFADAVNGGQIARYDHAFGAFAAALSANLSDDASDEDILAAGARYTVSLPAMELGLGVGYSQLHRDSNDRETDAVGVSFDANFNNGIRAILNWVDMGDGADQDPFAEKYIGVGLGYAMDDWIFAANWGEYSEDRVNEKDGYLSGYAIIVNYDLGGGAEVQLGYSKASCADTGPVINDGWHADCSFPQTDVDGNRISLGVAMSF